MEIARRVSGEREREREREREVYKIVRNSYAIIGPLPSLLSGMLSNII